MAFNYKKYRKDFTLLFFTRITRMVAYGMLGVIFFQNLFFKGCNELQSSWIQAAIVLGDIFISLYLTSKADKIGRIFTLMLACLLQLITGIVYSQSSNKLLLLIVGTVGIISVTGGEIGPFTAIEKSALAKLVQESTGKSQDIQKNTAQVLRYYNVAGYLAQGFGSLLAGQILLYSVQTLDYSEKQAFKNIMRIYAILIALMCFGYYFMTSAALETDETEEKKIIICPKIESSTFKIKVLCAADALASAFVAQTFIAYYYAEKYERDFDSLGIYLWICNVGIALGVVLSQKMSQKLGPLGTIYTDLPSNILLILIAFTNNLTISITLLICRFCLCQSDSRKPLINLLVLPAERSGVTKITKILWPVFFAIGLGLNGFFLRISDSHFTFSLPFVLAGSIKIAYDFALLRSQALAGSSQGMSSIANDDLDEAQVIR